MTQDNLVNKKRLAKNTLLLYFRMLFLMIVNLYTSRVVLNALGVEDYGIYNVVGGIVVLFTTVTGSLSTAISRFFTFELGSGNKSRLSDIFSSGVTIQIMMAIVVALFAEIGGVWFLNYKMVIPVERLLAANWVFQLSIVTFCVNLVSIPYNAAIIAHERMSAFAYISILEAVGKLFIAFLIIEAPIDKLIYYALLMALFAFVIRFTYSKYCSKHFEECVFHFHFDTLLLKQMLGFSGWNFIGAASGVLRDTGGNLLLNLFGGPVVNAARGIANQVNNAVFGFATNFMTALNPQITKSYANGNREYMHVLIYQGARLAFFLLLVLSLPIILNTDFILQIWLGTTPYYAANFIKLVLIFAMFESISYPLITAMLATGNIKKYQIIVGGLQMLNFPISYIALKNGLCPESVMVVAIIIGQLCLFSRLYLLQSMIGISMIDYLKKVYINIIFVSLISIILPYYLNNLLNYGWLRFIFISIISVINTTLVITFVGLNSKERLELFGKFKQILKKHYQ